ncbi:hypothetical protein INT43_002233 [Umbelopsis isabellina]|uniref:AAA+ ATPase domain-containing protein n=1 Tax=Mortierella isabellina TaxID=91625 RepID=A0A8H7UHB0_MORIS|nr:hypothetical protein INT43_002233 [Umbelopsis isabellina]
MQVQDATSNAPLAVAYVPVTLYKQFREHGRAKIWAKVTDQKNKSYYCHISPAKRTDSIIEIQRHICISESTESSGIIQASTVEVIKEVQKGAEVQVICNLKENVDELEQKQTLGFVWFEGTDYQKLKAIRDVLDGMLFSEECTIGMNSDRICLDIEIVCTTPSNSPIIVCDATRITIIDQRQSKKDADMKQLTSAMSKMSVKQIRDMKGGWGLSGLEKAYDALLEVVSYPLLYRDMISTLNIECPKGVLLYGPPGVGKTYLVATIAKACNADMIVIQGPEVFGPYIGESEEKLRAKFREATQIGKEKEAPVILFIDEIDAMCPNRQHSQSHESRVVAQLLTLMDGMENRGRAIVIGATNRPNVLDPALRRPGRFDREIFIDAPDVVSRQHILQSQTKGINIDNVEDVISELATMTNGYVAADLMALCREAINHAIEKWMKQQSEYTHEDELLNDEAKLTLEDFAAAMAKVGPSIQRGFETMVEKKTWDDIGGLEPVKQKLKQATEWPMLYGETFKRLGLKPPRGVLLFGPPGCSKTTLVKVIASVSGATFLSINGAQIYSPFVGDSEKIIRTTFQKARSAAPSIIFLDEIEAIVGKRNLGGGGSGSDSVQERVLSTLLNEMDGVEAAASVLIIGATNRPDMLDAALMRPGRFDKIIYVPPPDFVSRQQIMKVHTKNIPLAEDVDLEEIADQTNLYTGADLQNLCREAAIIALRQDKSATNVSQANFEAALKVAKPSLTFKTLKEYEALQKV